MADIEEKLKILSDDAKWDGEIFGEGISSHQHVHKDVLPYITYVSAGGKKIPILKVLLTNVCMKDCKYCGISARVTGKVVSFKPYELASCFYKIYRAGLVKGMLLSSGIIKNPDYTSQLLNQTARILRQKFGYKGYIHLKIMPGASLDVVDEAVKFADRISVNLESPNPTRLAKIAPSKDIKKDMMPLIKKMSQLYQEGGFPAGVITQFVAGGAGETDKELLVTADYLYKKYKLRRSYYSGFQPLKGTPMEDVPATPLIRQNRLYQADFLLRLYGFSIKDIVFDRTGNLPLKFDPKLAWALENQGCFPVEINKAPYEMLIRVPGIGPKGARKIIEARRQTRIRELWQLSKIGVVVKRLSPFILLDGRPVSPSQPELFDIKR